MSRFEDDEFINILVLGSSNTKISYFVKLFGAYLKYNTYKEVLLYEPNLVTPVENVEETVNNIVTIGPHNFRFIDTPGLTKSSTNYKEICDILLHFRKTCKLQAIILLIEPDRQEDENYFEQYTTHFFSGLKKFAKNILYVILYKDLYKYNQTYKNLQNAMDVVKMSVLIPKSNVFHLQESTFHSPSGSNWDESVSFCKDVFEYISCLKSFYIQSVIPIPEEFLNLIHILMELLTQIYHWAEFYKMHNRTYYISNYKNILTACYGKSCYRWVLSNARRNDAILPKICHVDCNEDCNNSQTNFQVENCSVFHTSDKGKICSICHCGVETHQKYVCSKNHLAGSNSIHREKSLVLSTLAQFYLFLKQYVPVSIEDFISKEVEYYPSYDNIITTFKTDFEEDLKLYSTADITREKLVICISKLFEIKEMTGTLPKVINDNFPAGFRLEVISKPKKLNNNSGTRELKLLKTENRNMKREMEQLKLRLDQVLNFGSNNLSGGQSSCEKQNNDKLNIEQNDDVTSDSNSDGSDDDV